MALSRSQPADSKRRIHNQHLLPDVPVVRFFDRANEFRICIEGRFAADCVGDTLAAWTAALRAALPRKTVVDISHMTGYDTAGRKALREMHLHGTEFAASTVESLAFLAEITAPRRRHVTVIPEPASEPQPPSRETNRQPAKPLRAVAGRGKNQLG